MERLKNTYLIELCRTAVSLPSHAAMFRRTCLEAPWRHKLLPLRLDCTSLMSVSFESCAMIDTHSSLTNLIYTLYIPRDCIVSSLVVCDTTSSLNDNICTIFVVASFPCYAMREQTPPHLVVHP